MKNKNLALLEIGKLVRETFRVLKKRINEQNDDEIKLTNEQFGLLHLISIKEEDVIQKDMADCLGKDKSSVLRLIDSLEKKDLIRRVVDKKDRRKNYLMITKKGERVIKQIKEISFEMMKELQEGISETELQIFRNVAGLLISNAEKL